MKKLSRTLTLIAASGILLSACSSSATPTPMPSAAATPAPATAAPATAAPATAAPATPTATATPAPAAFGCTAPAGFAPVWYASAPHPYFETVKPGVEAAAKEFGFTANEQIGPDWKQDSENQNMEALFAKGAKYFSVYPTDASGANALYQELTSKGATIVNFGASTLEPTTASLVFATDVKAAAMQATEALISTMGDKGNIINVLEVLSDPNTALRKAGVEEVVAKHPNVKIIQEISGMSSQEEAVQKVTDAIAANSNTVDGIIATGFTPTVAIAQVITDYKARGGTRTIHSVGIDTDPTVIKAISDGVMDGTISQNPFGHGYLSMLSLMCMADGWKVKAGVYRVDTGTAFVTKANLTTYADDIAKVTASIKDKLLTDVLEKGSATATPAPAAFGCTAPAGFAPVWYASAPHPYFETVKPGVEAAAKEFGFTANEQIGPDWKQDSENQNMEALFAKGAKYFSVYPTDASGANALYQELTSKGATIVNFGASTLEPTTASLVFATDVKAAAMQATEALISTMGDKGNIINVLEVLSDPNTALRKAGVEEVVAKHPNVKIIQEISGMSSQEEAVQKVTDAIAANSNTVDGIIATGFTPTVAIAQVITDYKARGGTRTIHSVGIDTDPTVIKAISDGVMDGTISQNPFGHGYLSMLSLMCMADGWKVKAGVYRVDTGTAFVTKANLTTYADDIAKVTASIKDKLLTDVLTK